MLLQLVTVALHLLTSSGDSDGSTSTSSSSAPHRVAIVGGGVGGSSAAFFLRRLMGDNVDITVYEAGEVGGRVRGVTIGGKIFDSGASIIHSANEYAKQLTSKVGLTREDLEGSGGTGLYDGQQFVLKLNGGIGDKMRLLRRYGFGLSSLLTEGSSLIERLDRIYCLQSHKVGYETVAEFLNATHHSFLSLANVTMGEHLTQAGISKLIQEELVAAALHTNYNQGLSVNAFVGFVSLAGGMVGKLWRVKDGNFQLPPRLLEHAGVTVLNEKVRSVTKEESGGYAVTTPTSSHSYDAVILATPLHDAAITLDSPVPLPAFQRTIATFVEGSLRELVKGEKNPSDILTTVSPHAPFFSSIGTKGTADSGASIYKVFSSAPLSPGQLEGLFSEVREVREVDWHAYPHYNVSAPLPSFQLAPGLYHLNAIEQAASAIEMSCIGGRNVANLAWAFLSGREGPVSGEGLCEGSKRLQREEL